MFVFVSLLYALHDFAAGIIEGASEGKGRGRQVREGVCPMPSPVFACC